MGGEAMSRCDEYCANYGCNNGPGCPAGGGCHSMPGCKDTACPGHPGAKVAKVKASRPSVKHKSAQYVQPIIRRQLKHLAKWMLIALAVMTIMPAVLSVALAKQPPARKCTELLARDFVPAHVRIKCKIAA